MANAANTNSPGAQKPAVAVIGAGLAGLITAVKLADAGYRPAIYEAAKDAGGRVKSVENPFGEGGHFVTGGEIIDRGHPETIALCKELGVDLIDRHEAIPGDGLMVAGGKTYRDENMLDSKTGKGDFAALADAIRRDQQALRNEKGEWTEAAKALDKLSIDDYLAQKVAETGTAPHVAQILKAAYTSEIGRNTGELSALNLIDFIGTNKKEDFAIYGDSDETYAVKGGTSAIVKALMKKLEGKADFHFGEKLSEVRAGDGPGKTLVLSKAGEPNAVRHFDYVVNTLPLPALGELKGAENLGLSEDQLARIRGAQYNQYTKIMAQTKGRPWEAIPGFNGEVTAAGSGFQVAWPSSDEADKENRSKNGTVTFLIGGKEGMRPPAEIVAAAKRDYAALLGKPVDEVFTPEKAWVMQHGKTGGCLPAPAPGGYLSLVGLGKELQQIPGAGFAGSYMTTESEHGTWIGFINNATVAGGKAAEKAIGELQAIEQERNVGASKAGAAPALSAEPVFTDNSPPKSIVTTMEHSRSSMANDNRSFQRVV